MVTQWLHTRNGKVEKTLLAEAFSSLPKQHLVLDNLLRLRNYLYRTIRQNSHRFLQSSPRHTLEQAILQRYHHAQERVEMEALLLNSCLCELDYCNIAQLSKKVFTLYYVQGCSYAQISATLNIPVNEVKQYHQQALHQLVDAGRIYALPYEQDEMMSESTD